MIVIVDYGLGNLMSLTKAFEKAGINTIITDDREIIRLASTIILPGVGAFKAAMKLLKEKNLIEVIKTAAKNRKSIIGICLGMQLLYEKSYENGVCNGLGIIKGGVQRLDCNLKIPHMGWNDLKFEVPDDPILKYIGEGDYVYFVHSYYAKSSGEEIIAFADYGLKVPAIVRSGNVYGMQFHPEKSAEVGANILKGYKELIV